MCPGKYTHRHTHAHTHTVAEFWSYVVCVSVPPPPDRSSLMRGSLTVVLGWGVGHQVNSNDQRVWLFTPTVTSSSPTTTTSGSASSPARANTRWTYRRHTGEHTGDIQVTYRRHTVDIQETYRQARAQIEVYGYLSTCPTERKANFQIGVVFLF